jgi:hypothetical protein
MSKQSNREELQVYIPAEDAAKLFESLRLDTEKYTVEYLAEQLGMRRVENLNENAAKEVLQKIWDGTKWVFKKIILPVGTGYLASRGVWDMVNNPQIPNLIGSAVSVIPTIAGVMKAGQNMQSDEIERLKKEALTQKVRTDTTMDNLDAISTAMSKFQKPQQQISQQIPVQPTVYKPLSVLTAEDGDKKEKLGLEESVTLSFEELNRLLESLNLDTDKYNFDYLAEQLGFQKVGLLELSSSYKKAIKAADYLDSRRGQKITNNTQRLDTVEARKNFEKFQNGREAARTIAIARETNNPEMMNNASKLISSTQAQKKNYDEATELLTNMQHQHQQQQQQRNQYAQGMNATRQGSNTNESQSHLNEGDEEDFDNIMAIDNANFEAMTNIISGNQNSNAGNAPFKSKLMSRRQQAEAAAAQGIAPFKSKLMSRRQRAEAAANQGIAPKLKESESFSTEELVRLFESFNLDTDKYTTEYLAEQLGFKPLNEIFGLFKPNPMKGAIALRQNPLKHLPKVIENREKELKWYHPKVRQAKDALNDTINATMAKKIEGKPGVATYDEVQETKKKDNQHMDKILSLPTPDND